jgi:hypothetical protein
MLPCRRIDRVASGFITLEWRAMSDAPNAWARFDIAAKAFAAIGLPVILGLIGYWHTEAEREANRRDLAFRDSIATLERQADRLTGLVEHLSSENARRRLIAIRIAEQLSLRNQLPPEIVPVLSDLANGGTDSTERATARAASAIASGGESRRDELITRLFGTDPRERIRASQALVQSWSGDPQMVPALLQYASANVANANGVFNTLGVLTQICPGGTRPYDAAVKAFVSAVRVTPTWGPRIAALASQLERCGRNPLRVWLLAGRAEKAAPFDSLRAALQQTGIGVAGTKPSLQDETRPPDPEVRYYNDADAEAAAAVAERARTLLRLPNLPVRRAVDPSAGPGYVEVWLGR